MGNILFWRRWPIPERIIFNLAALLFILSIAYLGYSYLITPSPAIQFQSIVEAQLTEIPYDQFQKGIFNLTIPGNNYTLTERLLGSLLQQNLTANYIWLACFTICITGLLAIATTASRYYYLGAMGVFILLVVSLKLETLVMFGRDDKIFTVVVLVAYGLCSFHMYYFLPALRFAYRLLYFSAITAITGLLIYFFSGTAMPGLHLATYSVPAGLIVCALFTVTVAHEIVAAFINILTRNTRQGKTINHFLLITLVYFLNLAAAYSLKFGYIKWNLFSIDLFVLLIISGILGIWGIRQRQKQLDGILEVEPYGVIGYALLGTMAFGAIGLFMSTANDPAYDAVADIIIFSHLGFGLIFVFYVISNFGNMLSNNMPVHKVLYNPNSMPFFTFRLAGLITTLAVVIYNTWQVPAHNAVASYQNSVADLYLLEGNTRVATIFYDQGRTYGFSNHRSNYMLANLAGQKFDHAGEKGFYKSASYLRPTEMSYLNWAQMSQTEENVNEAISILKEGLQHFPKSSALSNTLGLLYAERGVPDSAALFLQSQTSDYSSANLAALAARGRLSLLVDTAYNQTDGPALLSNKIAFASISGLKSGVPLRLPTDSALSSAQAAYINNYLVNVPGKIDTTTLARIEAIARYEGSSGSSEALLLAVALSYYSLGDISNAFRLVEEVAISSSSKGKYNQILSLWCLEHDEPGRAIGYGEFALSQEYTPSFVTQAIALTEALRQGPTDRSAGIRAATHAWDSVARYPDSTLLELANRVRTILGATPDAATSMTDENKYAYTRYRIQPWDTTSVVRLLMSIGDVNLKGRGLLETSQLLLSYDDIPGAVAMYNRARGIRVSDSSLLDALNLQERILLAAKGDLAGLSKLNESPMKSDDGEIYKAHFDALIAASTGDTVRATQKYEEVARQSFFYDEGILDASTYFTTHGTDPLRAYTMLVEAIQHHPSSIRLQKAYIREATRIGFTDFAAETLNELRSRLPEREFDRFAAELRTNQ